MSDKKVLTYSMIIITGAEECSYAQKLILKKIYMVVIRTMK